MSNEEATELLNSIEAYEAKLTHNGAPQDDVLRSRLQQAAQRISRSLESSFDLTLRLSVQMPVEFALFRLGVQMGIFSLLGSSQNLVPFHQIQQHTGAEDSLLARIMTGLAAFKYVTEPEAGMYGLSSSSSYLADPAFAKSYIQATDWLGPAFAILPQKLADEGYASSQLDPRNAATQAAYNAQGQSHFEMLGKQPELAASFSHVMSTWGLHGAHLYACYPVERLTKDFNPDVSDVLLVDVGGGWGQKSIALKKRFPDLPGRIVVQDLLERINSAPGSKLVDWQAHDFFTEQPIKGAKAYYLRQILHDWADDDAIKILQRLKDAMKPGYSKVLIHELVVPGTGASIAAVSQDFTMMTVCGALERTRKNWEKIVREAGLDVVGVFSSEDPSAVSVLEATRLS